MATWRGLLSSALERNGETWEQVESVTLTDEELDKEFDSGYGGIEGLPFTLWTIDRVYFPVTYDGSEWASSVSRYPDGMATEHKGGGC